MNFNKLSKFFLIPFFFSIVFNLFIFIAQAKEEEANPLIAPVSSDVVQKNILEKTPEFISKPVLKISNFLEEKRKVWGEISNNKKIDLEKNIDAKSINNKEASALKDNSDIIFKIWQQIQLTFFIIFSYVFAHKLLFYIVVFFVVFMILRSIYRIIYPD